MIGSPMHVTPSRNATSRTHGVLFVQLEGMIPFGFQVVLVCVEEGGAESATVATDSNSAPTSYRWGGP